MDRKIKTRIAEHRNHINRNTIAQSVITDRLRHDHEFDWTNVKILDIERYLNKRLTSEMYQIAKK